MKPLHCVIIASILIGCFSSPCLRAQDNFDARQKSRQQLLDSKLASISTRYGAIFKKYQDDAESIKNNAPKPNAAEAAIGISGNVTMEDLNISFDIPQVTGTSTQKISFDIPEFESQRKSMTIVEVVVGTEDRVISDNPITGKIVVTVPTSATRNKEIYFDLPTTVRMKRIDMSFDLPNISMKRTDMHLKVPSFTVKNVRVEVNKSQDAGKKLSEDATKTGEAQKTEMNTVTSEFLVATKKDMEDTYVPFLEGNIAKLNEARTKGIDVGNSLQDATTALSHMRTVLSQMDLNIKAISTGA